MCFCANCKYLILVQSYLKILTLSSVLAAIFFISVYQLNVPSITFTWGRPTLCPCALLFLVTVSMMVSSESAQLLCVVGCCQNIFTLLSSLSLFQWISQNLFYSFKLSFLYVPVRFCEAKLIQMMCVLFSRLYAVSWPVSLLPLQPPWRSLQDEEHGAPGRKCLHRGLQTMSRYSTIMHTHTTPIQYVTVFSACFHSAVLP